MGELLPASYPCQTDRRAKAGCTGKLTPAPDFPTLCPQRLNRFAPNSRSGIFIVVSLQSQPATAAIPPLVERAPGHEGQ